MGDCVCGLQCSCVRQAFGPSNREVPTTVIEAPTLTASQVPYNHRNAMKSESIHYSYGAFVRIAKFPKA